MTRNSRRPAPHTSFSESQTSPGRSRHVPSEPSGCWISHHVRRLRRGESPSRRREPPGPPSRTTIMSPIGLVVARLRAFEPVAGEGFDRVGRARDQLVDVLVGLERREDVVGDRPAIAATRPPDPYSESQELLRAERLRDRAKAVVAGQSTAEPSLQSAGLEVDVVVDDEERRRLDLEEAGCGSERPSGLVHVGLRLQQREPKPVETRLGEAAGELRAERAAVPARELVRDEPADVVPGPLVLAPRIAETRDEQVERRGLLAPTQHAHRLVLDGAGLARGVGPGLGRCLRGTVGRFLALRQLDALLALLEHLLWLLEDRR